MCYKAACARWRADYRAAGAGRAVVVTERACDPAAKGESGTSVSAPVNPSIVYADTSLDPEFAA